MKSDLREMVESAGGKLSEVAGPPPDGSGFAAASFPLPAGHWSTEEGLNVPPMPFRCGEDEGVLRRGLEAAVQAAARYAVRASTMNGSARADPDALVQNFVVGMLGYHTADGLRTVRRSWRWWLSWFTRSRPFSKCPCCVGPIASHVSDGWVVSCEHGEEVSPTRRLARFNWERRVRMRRKYLTEKGAVS